MPGDGVLGATSLSFWQQSTQPDCVSFYLCKHQKGKLTDEGFRVESVLEGTSARDLNRTLLSALWRIDRRATIHAAWTIDGITERFFDYTSRGTGGK